MLLWQAAALGVAEGLTEFLPVSSTGHLLVLERLFGLAGDDFAKSFVIAIQFGAVAALGLMYAKKIWEAPRLALLALAGFLPTAVAGFLLYPFVKGFLLDNIFIVIWSLLIGGIVIIAFEKLYVMRYSLKKDEEENRHDIRNMSLKNAFVIGSCQIIAMIPGVSRSAATVIGGMAFGFSRAQVVEFSFLLALPTMAAAGGYDVLKNYHSFVPAAWPALAVGFATAFATAWLSARWLLSFVRAHGFAAFGWYRIALALFLFWFFA